jgi:hypothetical protein
MIPSDTRLIAKLSAACLDEEELRSFIDERNAFKALTEEED